jgi:hypothetical protein
VGLLFSLAFLALAWVTGMAARRGGTRPGWTASVAGLVYGFITGLGVFFVHETLAQARQALATEAKASHAAPTLTAQQLVRAANAPASHFTELALSVVLFAVLALAVGSLGGALSRPGREDPHAV